MIEYAAFFAGGVCGLVLHELAHAIAARYFGVFVDMRIFPKDSGSLLQFNPAVTIASDDLDAAQDQIITAAPLAAFSLVLLLSYPLLQISSLFVFAVLGCLITSFLSPSDIRHLRQASSRSSRRDNNLQ